MPQMIQTEWAAVFAAKLGVAEATETDAQLVRDLLNIAQNNEMDFTILFHNLISQCESITETENSDLNQWLIRWHAETSGRRDPALMRKSNPAVIQRNHQVEAVITAAVNGDFDPFHDMLRAVTRPFETHDDYGRAKTA